MRVSREQFQHNKKIILAAAGRLFREKGLAAVTVTEVMKSAGLTHGGFYSYFASKEDLIDAAMAEAIDATTATPGEITAYAEQYLSRAHRENLSGGCPIAALATEAIRHTGGLRAEMTMGLERKIVCLSKGIQAADEQHQRRAAIGTWSAMVGALILSRMSDNPALADEMLNETRAWLLAQTD